MPRVEINSNIKIGLDEILQGIGKLETTDLEKFIDQVSNLIARRKAPNLSKEESKLLLLINQGFSKSESQKYNNLAQKLQSENITAQERKEFLKLVKKSEVTNAQRMEALFQLSKIRKVSLDDLMKQLNLNPSLDA